jgi:hypothetical protein
MEEWGEIGDALPPPFFNFALGYAIRKIQVNQDGVILNGKHHFLFCANELGRSAHTIKKQRNFSSC